MQCTFPVVIVRRDGRRSEVPCGQCVSCRVARARVWATRCVHEASYCGSSAFTTLTYRDSDLPRWASLDLDEFTKFWKRLRKSLGSRRIRYYGCGEYGELMGRPHYHVLVFGLRPCSCSKRQSPGEVCRCEDRRAVFDAWGHGGVDRLGVVTYDSARYCADYIGKVVTGRHSYWEYTYRHLQVPFQVMSQGIGRQYVDLNSDELASRMGVTVHGVQVGLPRYYLHRLEKGGKEVRSFLEREYFEVVPSRRRNTWVGAGPYQVFEGDAARLQRDKDATARQWLFRKGAL